MGFFSAVKKFFAPREEPTPESVPAKTGQEPEESLPQIPEEDAQDQTDKEILSSSSKADLSPSGDLSEEPAGGSSPEAIAEEDAGAELATKASDLSSSVQEDSHKPCEEAMPDVPEPEAINEAPAQSAQADIAGEAVSDGKDNELLLALRAAEPRLSAWLDIILEGQETADAEFWRKLKFLLGALEAPAAEIDDFTSDFGQWLDRMEYRYVDEFRSELQYRLALALDLEDEEDERNRLMLKLAESLTATREQLGRHLDSLFARHGELDDAFWEEMEELFIMADLGYEASLEMVERLKRRASRERITKAADARKMLQEEFEDIFRIQPHIRSVNKPEVILMMGVNGAGKTTTIAKLAHRAKMNGKKVLVAAADTFRAAAIEQLQVWADRVGVDFYARPAGSDPASVAWEAMDYALKNGIDTIFIDTAGRLQTRVNLMEELGKIRQVLAKKHPGSPHRNILVLDATTGQNALSQARLFREAAGADEIILTKLDGTAKGGVAIAVAMREKLPISYIGLGEKMEDLRPFDGENFARAIIGE